MKAKVKRGFDWGTSGRKAIKTPFGSKQKRWQSINHPPRKPLSSSLNTSKLFIMSSSLLTFPNFVLCATALGVRGALWLWQVGQFSCGHREWRQADALIQYCAFLADSTFSATLTFSPKPTETLALLSDRWFAKSHMQCISHVRWRQNGVTVEEILASLGVLYSSFRAIVPMTHLLNLLSCHNLPQACNLSWWTEAMQHAAQAEDQGIQEGVLEHGPPILRLTPQLQHTSKALLPLIFLHFMPSHDTARKRPQCTEQRCEVGAKNTRLRGCAWCNSLSTQNS